MAEMMLSDREEQLVLKALSRRLNNLDNIYRNPGKRHEVASLLSEARLLVEEAGPVLLSDELGLQIRKALFWAARDHTGWGASAEQVALAREHYRLLHRISEGDDGVVRVRSELTGAEHHFLFGLCRRATARRRTNPHYYTANSDPGQGLAEANLLEVIVGQLAGGETVELVERQIVLVREILMTLAHRPRGIIGDYPEQIAGATTAERRRLQQRVIAARRRLQLIEDIEQTLDRQSAGVFSTCCPVSER